MKKVLYTTLFLLAMLISLVGIVAAAPLSSKTAVLVSVEYIPDKGPVFTFRVSGKFSRAELRGSLHVQGGRNYGLHCTQVDEDTVTCNTSKKVEGVNVSLNWGGFAFWSYVPGAPNATEYCYSVYDWNADGPPYVEWVNFGTYCQDSPADYGDVISWYNPGWEETYDYEFMPESPNRDWCSFYHPGDAYYFQECPGEEFGE